MITKPKGTYDLLTTDAKLYTYICHMIEDFMNNYNYEYIRTPIFEATELFHRSVGENTDIVTKETYDFLDRGNRSNTLRPEGTAGIVRSLIENKLYGNKNECIKLFYTGTMYRYERPQSGRNREFTQFGIEAFNSNDPLIDAEVISIGYYLLESLGIEVNVAINSLGDAETRKRYTKALIEYIKPQIENLCPDCQNRLKTNPLRILDCKADADNIIIKNAPKISDYLSEASINRFRKIKAYLGLLDVDYEVNEKIVRGLDYYDENVWEYVDENGVVLGGGGRYNHLVENLGGPNIPAVGFAIGLERVMNNIKQDIDVELLKNNVDVYIMSISEEEKMYALRFAQNLRLNNIMTEINSAALSLKSQFKVADSLKAKFIIMLNENDLQKGIIKVKDTATKEIVTLDEKEIVDWLLGNI